jgi:hypothetical protein
MSSLLVATVYNLLIDAGEGKRSEKRNSDPSGSSGQRSGSRGSRTYYYGENPRDLLLLNGHQEPDILNSSFEGATPHKVEEGGSINTVVQQ